MDAIRLADARSLELHRAIAAELARDPSKMEATRERVRRWQEDRSVHPVYADRWAELISGPLDALLRMLVDESERARDLRHVTPFAGVIDPRTRWRIWSEVRERMISDG